MLGLVSGPFSGTQAQTPGGVNTNLSIWLKADNGPERSVGVPATAGDAISRWLDVSGNARHYVVVAGPTLAGSALNFNAGVEILNGGFDAPAGSELGANWTIFTISKKLASDPDGRVFDGHTGNFLWSHWGTYTNSIYINGNPSNFNSGIATTTGIQNLHLHAYTRSSVSGAVEARADGTSLATFGTSNTASGVRIDLNQGAFSAETSDSQVGEMIVYDRVLTAAEIQRVESYLAIKYGITLTTSYVNAAGTTIWDIAANAGFNHDITGIGADATSGLDQRKSQSINPSTILTVDKGGAITNGSFLVWGDNNGTGTSANVPTGYVARSSRVWKAAVTGSPGTTTISFDLSNLSFPNTTTAGNYALLIDNDTDFSTGATQHTTGASLVGNTLSFTNVSLTNNQFFTIVVNSSFTTPGGVAAGLSTWLKSNAGAWEAPSDDAENGDPLVSWRDQSGLGHHYTAVAGPTWQATALNFNPAVEILSGGFDAPVGAELGTAWTTFFISKKLASDSNGRLFDGDISNYLWAWWDVYVNSLYLNGTPANHNTGIASTTGLTNLHLHTYKRDVSGSLEAREGGSILNTFATSASASGVKIDIDQGFYSSGESSDAHVGEMIVYNSALTSAEVNRIESYLGIKYGLTLAHDYLASDGTTVWSTTTNSGYNSVIVGIGRDNASNLLQPKSTSTSSTNEIVIDNAGAFGADKSFLMVGHNGSNGSSTNVPSSYSTRSNRIWKAVATNSPGTVTISIDLTNITFPNAGNASKYALLIDSDTDFSAGATAHTTGATLVGNVISFSNVTLTNNFIALAVSGLTLPGGVPGLAFWVKADAGVTGTTDVSNWADQSGFTNDAFQSTVANQPGLVTNDINFNPSINFNGGSDIFNITTAPANLNSTIFTVAVPTVNSQWRTMFRGSVADHPLIVEAANIRLGYYDNDNVGFKPSGFNWLQNEIAVVALEMRSGDVNFRKNGTQGSSITTINLSGLNLNFFGNYQGNLQQFGRIAETLIFNTSSALTTTEKQKIETYLAVKYGVTLSHDYLASNGAMIWNSTTNAAYGNNIAGIGRDDVSGLDQRKSKSINANTALTIDRGAAFGVDKNYLVWGDDNATGTSYAVPTGYTLRSARVWKTGALGTPGPVSVSFDLSLLAVPNTGSASNYALLRDTDNDFTAGATAYTTGVSIVGNVVTFTGVSFASAEFFTLGVANLSLPGGVAGGIFWVRGETGVVGGARVSQWTDQSGFNNHALQPTPANQPAPAANNINFRTVVNFAGSAELMTLSSPPASLNTTIFTVAAPTVNTNWRTMFRGTSADHPIIVQTGANSLGYYDADGGGFLNGGFTWVQNEVALVSAELRSGNVNFRKNGTQGSSISTINLTGLDLYAFGNYQLGSQPFGRVAETVVYQTASALTTAEKEKIESYLAIKYGITLSHNYTATDGTIVWNSTTNAAYSNNITGVGRDDASPLDQQKSLGVHTGATVTIDKGGAFATDKTFLIFGDDGGTGTSSNIPSSFLTRSGRVWKTSVTGSPGNVSLTFNLLALGLPATGAASDFAILIDTDADFSTGATVHTTGATLVGNALTFTGVSLANNSFFTLAATNLVTPGGLVGSVFWVKGDVGVTGTTDVSVWADQSGTSNNASQGTLANQPTLVSNLINSHAVIDFNTASDFFTLTTPPANNNSTVFVVASPKVNTSYRTLFRGVSSDHPIIVNNGSNVLGYWDADGGGFKTSGFNWVQSEVALVALEMRTGDVNFRKNGTQGGSNGTINLTSQALDWLGNINVGGQAFGQIAEAIVFNTTGAMTETNKRKVETYLALKYGITLTHDYINTAGTVVWDATVNATYQNDVAGIGRDDATGLDQRKSISVNSGTVVTMNLGAAFPTNNAFLIWGNNTGAMSASGVTDLPSGILYRIARNWKVSKLGTVGAVTVDVNLSSVPGTKTAADLRLLIDRNKNGVFNDETVGGGGVVSGATSIGGGVYRFTGVTFNDGELFSIGSAASSTPLPVTLVKFEGHLVGQQVVLSWNTGTELNNDHFSIQRSGDGAEFSEIGTVKGSGNSNTSKAYEFIDSTPLAGRSYYRLAQVDYDQKVTLSQVISIKAEGGVVLHPNPATATLSFQATAGVPLAVEFYNALGQKVYAPLTQKRDIAEITVADLPRGVYIVHVLMGDTMTTHKVVLQ